MSPIDAITHTANLFSILSDPVRRRILCQVVAARSDLVEAELVQTTQSADAEAAVTKLEKTGLLERVRKPNATYVTLANTPLSRELLQNRNSLLFCTI